MKKISIKHSLWQMAILAFLLSSFPSQEVQAQCSWVSESDSLALVDFYYATNGDDWKDNSGWLVAPIDEWHGITLTFDGCQVKEISLRNNKLEGVLTDLQLPNLVVLDLGENPDTNFDFSTSGNLLTGSIPDFSNLPNLTVLELDHNDLSGSIPDFSNLPNLTVLDLDRNDLSGSIPNFSNLPNLTVLDLDHNNLSGSIPDFSNLPNLRVLDLCINDLTGNIPDFINLLKLEGLCLNKNGLSGTIPDFSNLPNLKELDLRYNDFSGSVPDFNNLQKLEYLNLSKNSLLRISPDFSNLPNLEWLSLAGTSLLDPIPDFSNLPNLKGLNLVSCGLFDAIPNFSNLPNLTVLALENNRLSGSIPNFSNLPNLRVLDLENNDFSGSIPDFSNLPNLRVLDLENNRLSGSIPDFSNLPNLRVLDLNTNNLSDSIPDFSNLQNLEVLDLNTNNLSDSIPNFSNLQNLEVLDLNTNNLSSSIPDFSNLQNLEVLDLNTNNLSSSIPDFSNLQNLVRLKLEYNNLSERMPNFSNLPNLYTLQICPNNLQGGIPNFMFCPFLDPENVDFSCVESAEVSGSVFYDENANCIKDEDEKGIPNVFVYTDDEQFITRTDEEGFYVLKIDTGTYTFVSSWTNNSIWSQSCPEPFSPYTTTFTTYTDSIGHLNYAYQPNINCPQMKVEIGSPGLIRCFDNSYTINYCNLGTTIAENAYIELYFPDELIPLSSSIPYTVEDDHLIFNLGDIDLFESGSFTILDSVSCEASLGSTACVEAYVFPNDLCEISTDWSGADLEVKGECLDNSVQFTIRNAGSDMTLPKPYYLYENDILAASETFQLASGDSIVLSHEATGATFRLTVKQSLGHPVTTTVTEVIESCGDDSFTVGLVNTQWDGDDSPIFDSDCQEIVGSFDPNDKTVFPSGVLEGNHIPDSIDLTYRIRFQNTGNAVAYRVIIIDTIDTEHLELPSLELGAYSHDFELDVEDGNVLIFTFNDILLPDSTSNEPASHGFITYTLKQKAGNVIGDLITNEAGIYFDYNAPVITNKVLNTVGIPDTTTADFVYTSTPPISIYQDNLAAIVDYNSQQMTIQINEVQAGEQFSIQLFNVLGQEMFVIPNLSVPLHQEVLPQVHAGVYIYNIQSSEGRVARGKVLVR